MNLRLDPLRVLATTTDPALAAWAVEELRRAGFTNATKIAADFGWHRAEQPEWIGP